MKRFYIFISLLVSITIQAHQSAFLYFEDKNGAKDTLEIAIGLSDEEIAAVPTIGLTEAMYEMQKSGHHWVWMDGVLSEWDFGRVYIYKPYSGFIENGRKNIFFLLTDCR